MNEVLYLNDEQVVKADKSPKNILFKALCFIFFIGVFYGLFVSKGSESEILKRVTEAFLKTRTEKDFMSSFFSVLFSGSVFTVILCLNGFSALGQPLSFFTVFLNGVGVGLSLGSILFIDGTKPLFITLIIPSFLISGFAVTLAARESVRLSNKLFVWVLNLRRDIDNPDRTFSKYIKKFMIIFIIIIFSALVGGAASELFKRFVN